MKASRHNSNPSKGLKYEHVRIEDNSIFLHGWLVHKGSSCCFNDVDIADRISQNSEGKYMSAADRKVESFMGLGIRLIKSHLIRIFCFKERDGCGSLI